MTIPEIRGTLALIDPHIRHHRSMRETGDYTYWDETHVLPFTGDGRHQAGWAFVVHRYTKQENDEIAARLFAQLDADDRIAVSYSMDSEPETGYIHHIFDCEGA